MSARITTLTPMINENFLISALKELNIEFQIKGNEIITERIDYYGEQKFLYKNGAYHLLHDSSANYQNYMYRKINFKQFNTVNSFLKAVESAYNKAEKDHKEEILRLQEELRRKLEEERKRREELERNQALEEIKQQQFRFNEEKQKLQMELNRKQEEEKKLEEMKKAHIKNQKQIIEEKAKAMGYSVKEKQKGKNIQLILIRNS